MTNKPAPAVPEHSLPTACSPLSDEHARRLNLVATDARSGMYGKRRQWFLGAKLSAFTQEVEGGGILRQVGDTRNTEQSWGSLQC